MYLKIYDKKKKEILTGGLNVTSEGIISSEDINPEDILVIRGTKSLKSESAIFAGDILKFDLKSAGLYKGYVKDVFIHALKFARLPENFDSIIVEIHPRGNSIDLSIFKFSLNGKLIKEGEIEDDDYSIPTDGIEGVLTAEHYFGASEKIGEIDWKNLQFIQ